MDFWFFCEAGVYKVKISILNSNILDWEMSRNLYILADANTSVDNKIPLIWKTQNFRPTLIYATSYRDYNTDKILQQNYNNAQSVFVMNPWTLFELELL